MVVVVVLLLLLAVVGMMAGEEGVGVVGDTFRFFFGALLRFGRAIGCGAVGALALLLVSAAGLARKGGTSGTSPSPSESMMPSGGVKDRADESEEDELAMLAARAFRRIDGDSVSLALPLPVAGVLPFFFFLPSDAIAFTAGVADSESFLEYFRRFFD